MQVVEHHNSSVRLFFVCLLAGLASLLSSCYNQGQQTPDAWSLTKQQMDSISFHTTHHYTEGYNFIVRSDSVCLIAQLPAEALSLMKVDTLAIYADERIVVADIQMVPADSIDSVWVQVARDPQTIGWLHESQLLEATSPDNAISTFITTFSDTHLLIFLALFVVVAAAYLLQRLQRRRAPIVHFRDVSSPYPMLLCLTVATAATLYSSIQLFAPEMWRHFYFHPTLNPFSAPPLISAFLCSVWAMMVVALAQPWRLPWVYYLGLLLICAVNYVVFSVTTLYYIGYPLLLAYYFFAIRAYIRNNHTPYRCGHCGTPLKTKGVCPRCGAVNT
ncbi:MAG: zinc ribbon domain-containing protein [Prevotella sp.]|nr:zinc ribbon domain-containing protein [Prevotella sp.]